MAAASLTLVSLTRLAQPIVKDIYEKAKKSGLREFAKWELNAAPGKIARRIKKIDEVKTLWKSNATTSIRGFIHPPKILIGDENTIISRLSDLPENRIIVEGIVGQGKSIFLRSIAVEEILSNDAKRLPIFLELRTLTAKTNLIKALLNSLESYDVEISEDSFRFLCKIGKISILLDGFDELDESIVAGVYRDIDDLATRFPELQIIITSRPGNEIQKNSLFRILRIAPLTPAEYPAFLTRLGVKSEQSQAIRQAIRGSKREIGSLITTPLMLTLVVIVYETESQIPESLPEFFERLFQVVFSKHDHLKDNFSRRLQCGLSERSLQLLFEAFCCMSMQLGFKSALNNEQFYEAFDQAVNFSDAIGCDPDKFKEDIVSATCLMLEDGLDSVAFLHKSIQEYYTASFIKRLDEEAARGFYEIAKNKSHGWVEVLDFLRLIDPYRYRRDYMLPIIKSHRENIIERLRGLNDVEFVSVLVKLVGEVEVNYTLGIRDSGLLRCASISWNGLLSGDEIGSFQNKVISQIFEQVPVEISAMDFSEMFGPVDLDQKSLGRYSVSLKKIGLNFGVSKIRSGISMFEAELDRAELEANEIVRRQQEKKLIFTKAKK